MSSTLYISVLECRAGLTLKKDLFQESRLIKQKKAKVVVVVIVIIVAAAAAAEYISDENISVTFVTTQRTLYYHSREKIRLLGGKMTDFHLDNVSSLPDNHCMC